MQNEQIFRGRAGAYAKGRPGYAPQALEHIARLCPPSSHPAVADIGAGTGIFSSSLLEMGYEVHGVETASDMLAVANERLSGNPNFHGHLATAEQTGLEAGSVHFATAASAFHWFEPMAFALECKRILKPGGEVFLLINRRLEDDPFSLGQIELFQRCCPKFRSLSHGFGYTSAQAPHFFEEGFAQLHFDFPLRYSAEQLYARCLSSSYSLAPAEPGYEPFTQELRKLIDGAAQDGYIELSNETVLWHGRPR